MGHNNHIITRKIRVGKNAAEDDDLLRECFIENSALEESLDISCNTSILSGRTGSGKTAIIRHIESNQKHTSLLSLEDMSMAYISNSDILRFVRDIGADLSLFFQIIWKHILVIEYIKLKYRIRDEKSARKFLNNFFSYFKKDKIKEKSFEYLERYEKNLWIETDQNIKELVSKYEEKLGATIALDIEKFKTKAGYARNMSDSQKVELKARISKIINPEQLSELSRIIKLLAEDSDTKSDCYILIDKLDERWIDDRIKYRLINALFEALKKFRPIRNFKIIVAVRTDILEKCIQENDDSGFQGEKFKDYVVDIKWDKKSLKKLINRRIAATFKKQYSPKVPVSFVDIFPEKINGQTDSFDYLAERTLLRPRDIIAFVNNCFCEAEDKIGISKNDIINAEKNYSQSRYEALIDEWRIIYPNLNVIMFILKDKNESFKINGISDNSIDDFLLKFADINKDDRGAICCKAIALIDKGEPHKRDKEEFLKCIFSVLYRVGAVGIKLVETDKVQYSYIDKALVNPEDIKIDSSIRVVKMLHRSMGIKSGNIKV